MVGMERAGGYDSPREKGTPHTAEKCTSVASPPESGDLGDLRAPRQPPASSLVRPRAVLGLYELAGQPLEP